MRRQASPADFARNMNIWKGSALGPAHVLKQSAFFRSGNKSKKVFLHHIMARGTVDEVVLAAVKSKRKGQNALFDALKKLRKS